MVTIFRYYSALSLDVYPTHNYKEISSTNIIFPQNRNNLGNISKQAPLQPYRITDKSSLVCLTINLFIHYIQSVMNCALNLLNIHYVRDLCK